MLFVVYKPNSSCTPKILSRVQFFSVLKSCDLRFAVMQDYNRGTSESCSVSHNVSHMHSVIWVINVHGSKP